jgi:hypothetical protein
VLKEEQVDKVLKGLKELKVVQDLQILDSRKI